MCSAHDSPPYDMEDAPSSILPPPDLDLVGTGEDWGGLDRLLTWLGKGVIVFTIAYLTLHVAYAIWMDWLP